VSADSLFHFFDNSDKQYLRPADIGAVLAREELAESLFEHYAGSDCRMTREEFRRVLGQPGRNQHVVTGEAVEAFQRLALQEHYLFQDLRRNQQVLGCHPRGLFLVLDRARRGALDQQALEDFCRQRGWRVDCGAVVECMAVQAPGLVYLPDFERFVPSPPAPVGKENSLQAGYNRVCKMGYRNCLSIQNHFDRMSTKVQVNKVCAHQVGIDTAKEAALIQKTCAKIQQI
jgi:hypothetical protein